MGQYASILLGYGLIACVLALLVQSSANGVDYFYNFLSVGSERAVLVYLTCLLPVFLGGLAAHVLERFVLKVRDTEVNHPFDVIRLARLPTSVPMLALLQSLLFVVIASVYAIAGADIWYRDEYAFDFVPGSVFDLLLNSVEQPMGFSSVLLLYLVRDDRVALRRNHVALVLISLYLIGAGTRFAAVVIALYVLTGDIIRGKMTLQSFGGYCLSFVALFWVIGQRAEDVYGILTFTVIFAQIGQHFSEAFDLLTSVVASPVFIVAETAWHYDPQWATLLVEISPLSGEASGWYKISDELRLNPAVPYSGLAVISAHGVLVSVAYGLVCGGVFSLLRFSLNRVIGSVGGLISGLLIFLHISLLMQYNLRSATRWVYYSLALAGVIYIFGEARRRTSR